MAKILVADDNSNIQKMVVLALKDQGIDVVAVGNGEAAVRKVSDVKPDLVLADIFMPVRNGYEVCKFIKDSPQFAHIPVILLVGAFDPLDEQEAQRVGADGVLKKPFVPPDPLISMVKSALARAGVSLDPAGAAKAQGGTPPPPMPVAKIPEIQKPTIVIPPPPAPIVPDEEFALPGSSSTRPAPFTIEKSAEPLAFGSLLDTAASEDETVYSLSPATHAAPDRDWGHSNGSAEEEREEAAEKTSNWRVSSLPDAAEETPAGQKDWREAAFSGIGADNRAQQSSTSGWAPSIEKQSLSITEEEAAELARGQESFPAIAAPRGQEDWAKAISAILPDKPAAAMLESHTAVMTEIREPEIAELHETPVAESNEDGSAAGEIHGSESAQSFSREVPQEIVPILAGASKPDVNSWMAGAVSAWDAEIPAKQLASAWDNAKSSPEALVQETSATEAFLNSGMMAAPQVKEESVTEDQPAEEDFYGNSAGAEPAEAVQAAPETEYSAHGSALEAPADASIEALLSPATQEILQEEAEQVVAAEPALRVASHTAADEKASVEANTVNMDEIVAKVLARMNPDVLQAVTREILKPLVEAMIKDEIHKR